MGKAEEITDHQTGLLKKTLEASNPNSHSHVCGNNFAFQYNTGGVVYNEAYLQVLNYSTPFGVDRSANVSTTDAIVAIGISTPAIQPLAKISQRADLLTFGPLRHL